MRQGLFNLRKSWSRPEDTEEILHDLGTSQSFFNSHKPWNCPEDTKEVFHGQGTGQGFFNSRKPWTVLRTLKKYYMTKERDGVSSTRANPGPPENTKEV
jgi:hypothetical protein